MKKVSLVLASSLFIAALAGCNNKENENNKDVDPIVPTTYSVSYEGNGSTAGEAPVDSTKYAENAEATVLDKGTLAKTDYEFVNWNTTTDGSGTSYVAGDKFSVTADTVLYAQWNKVTFYVTYDGNGSTSGEAPVDEGHAIGEKTTILSSGTLAMDDYHFVCWNTKVDGTGDSYNVGDELDIAGDITLYAQWDANWYVGVKNGLKAMGADAPLESIGAWLEKDNATLSIDTVEDAYKVYAIGEYEGAPSADVLLSDLVIEILESGNWALLSLDQSGLQLGVLDGIFFAKPNDETHKYVVMEFEYISDTSIYALFGYNPGITFYFYVVDGISAAEATSLLNEGSVRMGASDVLTEGSDLSGIADTFILDAEFSDPAKEMTVSVYDYLMYLGVDVYMDEGSIVVDYPSDEASAKANAEIVLGTLLEFTKASDWTDISEQIGYPGVFQAGYTYGTGFTINAMIAPYSSSEYSLLFAITCIDPNLVEILSFSLTSFAYGVKEDLGEAFSALVDEENYEVVDDFAEIFSNFAFSKDFVDVNTVIEIDYAEIYGAFIIEVYPSDAPLAEFPVDAIKALFSDDFTTEIPTMNFDLAWFYDGSDKGYIGIVALDPVAKPSATHPSLLDSFRLLMTGKANEWDATVEQDSSGTYYIYTSKEVNASGELIEITAFESENQFVLQFSNVLAPTAWADVDEELSGYFEFFGFETTSMPAPTAAEAEVWHYDYYSSDNYYLIYADDAEGELAEDYGAAVLAATTEWDAEETVVYDSSWNEVPAIVATSLEHNEDYEIVELMVYSMNGTTYVQVSIEQGPTPFPAELVGEFTSTYGFTTTVPTLEGLFYSSYDPDWDTTITIEGDNGVSVISELYSELSSDVWNVSFDSDEQAGTAFLVSTSKETVTVEDDCGEDITASLAIEAILENGEINLQVGLASAFDRTGFNALLVKYGFEAVFDESFDGLLMSPTEYYLADYEGSEDGDGAYMYAFFDFTDPGTFDKVLKYFMGLEGYEFDDSMADFGGYYYFYKESGEFTLEIMVSIFDDNSFEIGLSIY